jgi:type IV fimbrial biogenesis protein FimT
MNGMRCKRRDAGFTMTELIVVMMIIGILAAIGAPTFKYVTASNRIASEINGLLGDMQFARSEAVKEGQTVTVCASSNSTYRPPPAPAAAARLAEWLDRVLGCERQSTGGRG